jgi:hypothetical protein
MTEWHAEVTLAAAMDDAQLEAFTAAPGAFTVVTRDDAAGTVTAAFPAEAGTLRQAVTVAFETVTAAAKTALGTTPALTAIRVAGAGQYQRDLDAADLIGLADAGEILGISKERARQLARDNPAFPRGTTTALGQLYPRAAIIKFGEDHPRHRHGRPRKNPAPASGT